MMVSLLPMFAMVNGIFSVCFPMVSFGDAYQLTTLALFSVLSILNNGLGDGRSYVCIQFFFTKSLCIKFDVALLFRSTVVELDQFLPVSVIGRCKCDDLLLISYMLHICSKSYLFLCFPALTVSSVDQIKNPLVVCHSSIVSSLSSLSGLHLSYCCCCQWLRFLPSPSSGDTFML